MSAIVGRGVSAAALGGTHRIAFDQFYPRTGDYVAAGLSVFDGEGRKVHTYVITLSGEKITLLTYRHGLDNSDGSDARLLEAMVRWGLRRLEALLRDDPPVWDVGINNTRWTIGDEDLPELVGLVREKTCDYQVGDGRDLLCSAASVNDFQHRHAETVAGLAQPCASRADFRNRVDELDVVLKSMDVPSTDAPSADGAGSLVRFKRLIGAKAAAVGVASTSAAASRAVDDLLLVNRLRTAMQHPMTAQVDLASAHAALGVRYPTSDWAGAWRTVQQRVVGALNVLIRELNQLS